MAEHGVDKEVRRANILEFNPDGSGGKVYASGLRNPQGLDWAPGTNTLWVAVNERDELGDDLVPGYITSVKEGGFYGWPYSYWGQRPDPRLKDTPRMDLVARGHCAGCLGKCPYAADFTVALYATSGARL